jgi:molecular chaperone DnaK
VTFDIDANGVLHVTAKDLATGKENKITITASTKLSKEEKERMIREAEQFAEQDRKRKEEAELRNNADSLLYTAEKTKRDLKDKLTGDQISKIDRASGELREALGGKDIERIKQKSDELAKVLQEIGAAVYQQTAQQAQPRREGETGSNKGKVVDADYEVVGEERKKD